MLLENCLRLEKQEHLNVVKHDIMYLMNHHCLDFNCRFLWPLDPIGEWMILHFLKWLNGQIQGDLSLEKLNDIADALQLF